MMNRIDTGDEMYEDVTLYMKQLATCDTERRRSCP